MTDKDSHQRCALEDMLYERGHQAAENLLAEKLAVLVDDAAAIGVSAGRALEAAKHRHLLAVGRRAAEGSPPPLELPVRRTPLGELAIAELELQQALPILKSQLQDAPAVKEAIDGISLAAFALIAEGRSRSLARGNPAVLERWWELENDAVVGWGLAHALVELTRVLQGNR